MKRIKVQEICSECKGAGKTEAECYAQCPVCKGSGWVDMYILFDEFAKKVRGFAIPDPSKKDSE